jgi:hypothetical protein
MSNEDLDKTYIMINPNETNVDTGTQGVFRRSVLDFDMLSYSIDCDKQFNPYKKALVITCCDHVGDNIPITSRGHLRSVTPKYIGDLLNLSNTFIRNSETCPLICL